MTFLHRPLQPTRNGAGDIPVGAPRPGEVLAEIGTVLLVHLALALAAVLVLR